MDLIEENYSNIKNIDNIGIVFADGKSIVFAKTGFRSRARNRSDFIELQKRINEAGYRTRDLS